MTAGSLLSAGQPADCRKIAQCLTFPIIPVYGDSLLAGNATRVFASHARDLEEGTTPLQGPKPRQVQVLDYFDKGALCWQQVAVKSMRNTDTFGGKSDQPQIAAQGIRIDLASAIAKAHVRLLQGQNVGPRGFVDVVGGNGKFGVLILLQRNLARQAPVNGRRRSVFSCPTWVVRGHKTSGFQSLLAALTWVKRVLPDHR